MMAAQTPALGILKRNDWGDSQSYQVTCGCHNSEHDHHVWVEASADGEIVVLIYTTTVTPFRSMNRWQQMWQLLTRGHVKSEVALSMHAQQALNYAEALKTAVSDVKTLQAEQHGNS
jgi:hypothetical protein